jgi:hypothetical protein
MIKKMLLATAVIGGAMLAAAAPASAGEDHDRSGPGISILGNACVAPWHWEGPGNIATTGDTTYAVCNDNSTHGGGISIADNACVAPWHWEGPLNILTSGDTSYVVCNGNSAG